MRKKTLIAFSLLLVSVPYIIGWFVQGPDAYFSGLILNPIDGYSYFAKMYQGYSGEWLFRLSFTADPGKPAFLFEFYILLGQLSRLLNLSIPIVYHLTRLLSFVFVIVELDKFIHRNIRLQGISENWVLAFVIFGSGMGWIGLLGGYESADLLVAEGYIFYSALLNPHFILGMATMLYLLNIYLEDTEKYHWTKLIVGSALLAIIMPFGSVILCSLFSVYWIINGAVNNPEKLKNLFYIGIPAVLLVGFQYGETISHTQLRLWNQQNITTSPPLWDVLLSFAPMIIFAFYSFRNWKNNWGNIGYKIAVIWFIICFGMLLIPFELQRRFMFSLAIPVTLIGLYGLDDVLGRVKREELIKKVVFSIPIISIIFLFLIMGFSILNRSEFSFISRSEFDAYQWIKEDVNTKSVILSDEKYAIKIPGFTGHNVFYGHPFETIDAARKKADLEMLLTCQDKFANHINDYSIEENLDMILLAQEVYKEASCLHEYEIINTNSDFILIKVRE
ncbi:MAG: hypothetical protein JEZ00_08835 [Anaerolineaceae bacterium]|nr:hypothetical protein [Anaerolineaceae bacterium]